MRIIFTYFFILFFTTSVFGENKIIVCSINSGIQVVEKSGSFIEEKIDTTNYPPHTWTIDLDNEVVKKSNNKFLTTFDEEEIKWGFCYPQEGSCFPYEGGNLPYVGNKIIFNGEIFYLNRADLSYRHCMNISPFSCKISYLGQCKIEENKL